MGLSQEDGSIRNIVIVGGGTAGWMAAAAIASILDPRRVTVTLVESEAIGIIGVGEATLPHLTLFNRKIGLDETRFMSQTHATYKLGIQFENWARVGDSYIHPFGAFGGIAQKVGFHHYWRRVREAPEIGALQDYSLPIVAARQGRFERPSEDTADIRSTFNYAYQFDATRYAPLLRHHAEDRGVTRIDDRVLDVQLDADSGDIQSIELEKNGRLTGDFFIDCTGFRGVLIEGALQTGYEDWRHWLPCDSAIAAPSERHDAPAPFTRAIAHDAGWRWQIPLRHRTGNGLVFSSQFLKDDQAENQLRTALGDTLIGEPRFLRFVTGKRRKVWNKNCLSVGLSSGFMEPLESTSIHLIQIAITNFLELFPADGSYETERKEYNRIMDQEFARIRDFLILHYHATQRDDSEFWNTVRTMDIPDTLQDKMDLFKRSGRVAAYQQGLFLEPSWIAVYIGQRIIPEHYDLRASAIPEKSLTDNMIRLRQTIDDVAKDMPAHEQTLGQIPTPQEGPAAA